MGFLVELVGVAGQGVDAVGELGVLAPQVGPGVGQGTHEPGGVMVGEGQVQVADGDPFLGPATPGDRGSGPSVVGPAGGAPSACFAAQST
ncbi:hypothetical protein ACFV30_38930 [Streptomyces sp. NPDC059752]|uniref:hypothetical protein n=1 Tax=unclassified Streptomyces TaxID=2593676 RepID=UPI00365160D9